MVDVSVSRLNKSYSTYVKLPRLLSVLFDTDGVWELGDGDNGDFLGTSDARRVSCFLTGKVFSLSGDFGVWLEKRLIR